MPGTLPLLMDGDEFRVKILVAGAQKAGTTSLFGYFCDHPELLPPMRKESHFFDDEAIDWSAPDYSVLHRMYEPRDYKRQAFDITPIYLFWPPSLARIRDYNSTIKLILLFRDPIERAWSHWRMEYGRNAEDLPFHVAIRQGRWRLKGLAPLHTAWRVYSYVERGFYARQVRKVFDLFPQENVLLLRSNDLKRHHQATLGLIADFAGLSPFPSLSPRLDHRGAPAEHRLRVEDVGYLRQLFCDDIGRAHV